MKLNSEKMGGRPSARFLIATAGGAFRCAGYGRLEVDHVRPIKGGADHGIDPYDETNLQTLCRACHISKRLPLRKSQQGTIARR